MHLTKKFSACDLNHILLSQRLQKLHRIIQNKKRGMLTYVLLLLHDKTPPHAVACTPALLELFSWELFDHFPYSPYLCRRAT
jgi:hypothetical protein